MQKRKIAWFDGDKDLNCSLRNIYCAIGNVVWIEQDVIIKTQLIIRNAHAKNKNRRS